MRNKKLYAKSFLGLDSIQDLKGRKFKLNPESCSVEDEIIIKVPDYAEVKFFDIQFTKDTISTVTIHKWVSDKGESSFYLTAYMGKLRLCGQYNTKELMVECDKYGYLTIKELKEWDTRYYNPQPLELIEDPFRTLSSEKQESVV